MKKALPIAAVCCFALFRTQPAYAYPTPQEFCDVALNKAWRVYQSCIEKIVATWAKGPTTTFAATADVAFAKCRHAYFKKWTVFQTDATLATSTCRGNRYADNGDGTVIDNLTTLSWEKKTNSANPSDPHDADNSYSWSTGTNDEDGTAFATFLTDPPTGLDATGFAGSSGWRIPTLAELQSIVQDYPCDGTFGVPGGTCICASAPCIDAIFGVTSNGNYWTDTTYLNSTDSAWAVSFSTGTFDSSLKTNHLSVRAVRGGSF
ncbi:MAG: DUF1566 domain-containing protein [Deltaproteobacteria bacterium]|nr:DUF1566 domain-containing protein [Deltaproteobacteria bacterium]